MSKAPNGLNSPPPFDVRAAVGCGPLAPKICGTRLAAYGSNRASAGRYMNAELSRRVIC